MVKKSPVKVVKAHYIHPGFFDGIKPHQGGLQASYGAQVQKEQELEAFRRKSRDY